MIPPNNWLPSKHQDLMVCHPFSTKIIGILLVMIYLILSLIFSILHLFHLISTILLSLLFPRLSVLNLYQNLGLSVCVMFYIKYFQRLANRLKKVLPKIITEHQSAFTKRRLISDNILVAFESLHSIQKHTGKDDFMAIKVDMSKAYDRVEWAYLELVMKKLGFNDQWVKLLMVCVTVVSYSILVNREPKGLIHPSRGIRQGDSLSPFLFLLCTKRLHSLISQATTMGDIRGYSFAEITHG